MVPYLKTNKYSKVEISLRLYIYINISFLLIIFYILFAARMYVKVTVFLSVSLDRVLEVVPFLILSDTKFFLDFSLRR